MSKPAIYCEIRSRAMWRVEGERPRAFLHSMLTQDIDSIQPGNGSVAALLDEKGRLRAIVRVLLSNESSALLDCDQGSIEGVESGIVRLAPLGHAEMTRDDRVVLRTIGDALIDLVGDQPYSHVDQKGAILVRTVFGVDVLPEPGAYAEWADRVNAIATLAAPEVIDAYRIKEGLPEFGVDVSSDTLINETPLIESAVSFTKGCYPGQESVARVHNLGGVRHNLVVLQTRAPLGTEVFDASGASAGMLTSAALDENGLGFAFAYVKAESVPDELFVSGTVAAIVRS
ncbi:MAG: CAF17-like 4Fe-4S cluster assembly/insertion protein YgfZ [Actinomycetota bacterium]